MKTFAIIILFCIFCLAGVVYGENTCPTQTVKGTVVNKDNKLPIPGITIRVANTKLGAISRKDGSFKIDSVPVGRQTIKITGIGYEPLLKNIVVTSGSQQQLNIELKESYIGYDTVIVVGKKNNFEPINEAALVSSTNFTKDDVERFAGSRMDPARMAQNFAGVLGADDRRNDIIIRGGSPTELLWRLDGLDIPNPNHFATQGATGGPVNALNHNLLDNSDFFTGAFPADYGDRLSGVFDLKTRCGNMDRYEFLGEFGFNGFELGAQGPLGLEKSSFIINYRYSFLDLLQKMGVNFGFAGIPRYSDLMIKGNWDAGQNDKFSLTGLFGTSDIYIQNSKLDTVFTGDNDIKNGTDIYSLGVNWQHIYSERCFGNLLAGIVSTSYRTDVDSITTNDNNVVQSIVPWYHNKSDEGYFTLKYDFHYSFSQNSNILIGAEGRERFFNLKENRFTLGYFDKTLWNMNQSGTAFQLVSFINWNWRPAEKLIADLGVHSQYLQISNKQTIEPRAALSYQITETDKINLGFGIHNQSLPLLIYYSDAANKNLDFMKSFHYVAGWSHLISESALIKVELYYKDISNVPVFKDSSSSCSFINLGTSFGSIGNISTDLVSSGVGKSYGAEFSLTKNFSDGYYITATASYVRQQYKGSDGIWRFGAFDNIYIINILAGYEWKISPTNSLEFSGKFTTAGGSPYSPIDMQLSKISGSTFYSDFEAYSLRNPAYKRLDLRIDSKHNFNSFSITGYVSGENVTNQQNIYVRMYNRQHDRIDTTYQLGFFFVGGIRVEF